MTIWIPISYYVISDHARLQHFMVHNVIHNIVYVNIYIYIYIYT